MALAPFQGSAVRPKASRARTADGSPRVGWSGATGQEGIPIRIHESSAGPALADFEGWYAFLGTTWQQGNFEDDAAGFLPLPQWNFSLQNHGSEVPAAFEVDVYYPRTKSKIVEGKSQSRRRKEIHAMLTPDPEASVEDGSDCFSGSAAWGKVKVTAVEPDEARASAKMFFLLPEPRRPACGVDIISPGNSIVYTE